MSALKAIEPQENGKKFSILTPSCLEKSAKKLTDVYASDLAKPS